MEGLQILAGRFAQYSALSTIAFFVTLMAHAQVQDSGSKHEGTDGGTRPVEKINGPLAWQRASAKYVDKLDRSGLPARYVRIRPCVDFYERLYEHREFGYVEESLTKMFSKISDPYSALEYSFAVDQLGTARYGVDPETCWKAAVEWTEHSPTSHFAWLVRGLFAHSFARYWRGDGSDDSVTEEGRAKFRMFMDDSRTSLTKSSQLEPNDPESEVGLMEIDVRNSNSRDAVKRRFQRIITMAPSHFRAYARMMAALTPEDGATWEEFDSFLEEADRQSQRQGNPLLRTLCYYGFDTMSKQREGYKDILERADTAEKMIAAFRDCVARWPDRPKAHADYCRVLYISKRYPEALEQFEWLGDRYVSPSLWKTISEYNYSRAYTYFSLAVKAQETQTKLDLLSKADALAPQAYWLDYRGTIYRKLKQFDPAETFYLRALEEDPTFDNTWLNLTGLYLEAEKYQQAADLIEQSRQYGINDAMCKRLDQLEQTARLRGGNSTSPGQP